MIASIEDTKVWNDSASCAEAGHYRMMQPQKEVISNIAVIPNPASETATVLFNNSYEKNCMLNLLDYLGNKVSSYVIAGGQKQLTIDVRSLSAGLYFMQLDYDKSLTAKLVVIK